MDHLLGHSITYRIAVSPQAGRKVCTLQTVPACDPEEPYSDTAGKIAGFCLHAGVAVQADERKKPGRFGRYISRPAVSEKRLSLTSNGNLRYPLKTPYRDGTTHVIFELAEGLRLKAHAGWRSALDGGESSPAARLNLNWRC